MTRLATGLLVILGIASIPTVGRAQQQGAEGGAAEPAPAADAPAGPDLSAAETPVGPPSAATLAKRYEDIVVVPRKAFLKTGRLELAPMPGVSINDLLIRHYALGGELNYFLSDVFWIGLQGFYFIKEKTDRESLIGLQYYRVATLNRYLYTAALNFGYAPAYGKFTLFNRYIMHWELYASAGAGVTQSEIIPRKPGDATFKSMLITPNFGVGARFFLFDWLTVNFSLRDYVFSDKFEPLNRGVGEDIESVKNRASSQLVNNVMFFAGVGLFLPPGFDYKSPR